MRRLGCYLNVLFLILFSYFAHFEFFKRTVFGRINQASGWLWAGARHSSALLLKVDTRQRFLFSVNLHCSGHEAVALKDVYPT